MPARPDATQTPSRLREYLLPLVILLALANLIAIPVLAIQMLHPLGPVQSVRDFDDLRVPSEWADQALFHRPIIDTMREQWPAIDIVEYDSATAPGYHALMATVLRLFAADSGSAMAPLLIVNLCIGLALIAVVYIFAARLAGPWPALILCLPLATSKYILGGTAFLTTDNLAWLLAAIVLGLSAFSRAKPARLLGAGVACTLAVGVRQIMIWSAGPIVLAGLLASPLVRLIPIPTLRDNAAQSPEESARWKPLIFACIGAGLAFALLGVFVLLWGGLLPKASEFVRIHAAGPNPATPAFLLALIGACGVFFLPLVWDELSRLLKSRFADPAALLAIALGALCAIAVQTSSTIDQPRDTQLWKARAYGWLWEIARRTPDVAERSLVIVGAAAAGALGLLLLWRAAGRAGHARTALILLVALLAFTCAQTLNTMAWQRYFEPIVLVSLAWLSALIWPHAWQQAGALRRKLMLLGPAALGTLLMALSVLLLLLPMIRYASS